MGDNEAFFELLLAYIVWFLGNLQVALQTIFIFCFIIVDVPYGANL